MTILTVILIVSVILAVQVLTDGHKPATVREAMLICMSCGMTNKEQISLYLIESGFTEESIKEELNMQFGLFTA